MPPDFDPKIAVDEANTAIAKAMEAFIFSPACSDDSDLLRAQITFFATSLAEAAIRGALASIFATSSKMSAERRTKGVKMIRRMLLAEVDRVTDLALKGASSKESREAAEARSKRVVEEFIRNMQEGQ